MDSMAIHIKEMINIHSDVFGISINIPMIEAKLLSIGICSPEIEKAVMDFLLSHESENEIKSPS